MARTNNSPCVAEMTNNHPSKVTSFRSSVRSIAPLVNDLQLQVPTQAAIEKASGQQKGRQTALCPIRKTTLEGCRWLRRKISSEELKICAVKLLVASIVVYNGKSSDSAAFQKLRSANPTLAWCICSLQRPPLPHKGRLMTQSRSRLLR